MNSSHIKHFFFSFFTAIAGAGFLKDQMVSLWYIIVPIAWEYIEYHNADHDYSDAEWKESGYDLIASYLGFAVGYGVGYLLRLNDSTPAFWSS